MAKSDEFYIGWQEKMSPNHLAFLRKRLGLLFLTLPVLAFVFVFFQKPFSPAVFEFGKVQSLTGIYHAYPIPMLEVKEGPLPPDFSANVLLVGFGKFGVQHLMEKLEAKHGALHGKELTLAGTLIYGEGKCLLELTRQENSLVKVSDKPAISTPRLPLPNKSKVLSGEILDAKCYFGVMKPGEGKIHKSCAIRCISGGIPAVLRHDPCQGADAYEYYVLLNDQGQLMQASILPYVGEHFRIEALVGEYLDWNFIALAESNLPVTLFSIDELCGGHH